MDYLSDTSSLSDNDRLNWLKPNRNDFDSLLVLFVYVSNVTKMTMTKSHNVTLAKIGHKIRYKLIRLDTVRKVTNVYVTNKTKPTWQIWQWQSH